MTTQQPVPIWAKVLGSIAFATILIPILVIIVGVLINVVMMVWT